MKSLRNILTFLIIAFFGVIYSPIIQAQAVIKSSNYSTMFRIDDNGVIQDGSYRTVARINGERIQDDSYRTIGYVKNRKIQDSSYRTLGYVKDGGRVVDGSYRTLGYIKSDGRVVDSSYRTLGYAPSSLKEDWVAVVFFFLDLE